MVSKLNLGLKLGYYPILYFNGITEYEEDLDYFKDKGYMLILYL